MLHWLICIKRDKALFYLKWPTIKNFRYFFRLQQGYQRTLNIIKNTFAVPRKNFSMARYPEQSNLTWC